MAELATVARQVGQPWQVVANSDTQAIAQVHVAREQRLAIEAMSNAAVSMRRIDRTADVDIQKMHQDGETSRTGIQEENQTLRHQRTAQVDELKIKETNATRRLQVEAEKEVESQRIQAAQIVEEKRIEADMSKRGLYQWGAILLLVVALRNPRRSYFRPQRLLLFAIIVYYARRVWLHGVAGFSETKFMVSMFASMIERQFPGSVPQAVRDWLEKPIVAVANQSDSGSSLILFAKSKVQTLFGTPPSSDDASVPMLNHADNDADNDVANNSVDNNDVNDADVINA